LKSSFEDKRMIQGSDEWKALRVGRVTASRIGSIMGWSPYMSRDDVLREMVRQHFGAEPEFTGNIATEYGQKHEPLARHTYEIETCNKVRETVFFHTNEFGASPDGMIDPDGILEIKCPFAKRKDKEPKFTSIHDDSLRHYMAQVQWNLYMSDRKWCDFYQWSPNGSRLERVERDEEMIALIWRAACNFYSEYQAALLNPDEHLEEKRRVIDTPTAQKMVTEWDELRDQIDLLTERKKALLEDFIALAKGGNAIIAGRRLTQVESKGAISYAKAIKELLPDADLTPYQGKPTISWRFT